MKYLVIIACIFLVGCYRCDQTCQELDKLAKQKKELLIDLSINEEVRQQIDSIDCNQKLEYWYNQWLNDRKKWQRETILCNEKKVRELYHQNIIDAIERINKIIVSK